VLAEDGEPWAVSIGLRSVTYLESNRENANLLQGNHGVTPNWCTPLWTDLLNDYRVI
jgi:hypothetical protein